MPAAAVACDDRESPGPSAEPGHAAVATASGYTIRSLGTLGGSNSTALAINNTGATVGWSDTRSGQAHAFLYQAGVMHDLGALAGGRSEARAVNDAGTVVGWSTVLAGDFRAVRWQNGVKRNLGTLGGRTSVANGINEDGVIVGYSETASGALHAFVWKNGVMTDIGTLGGTTSHAWGINDVGKVVGSSTTASGKLHAFSWANGTFQDLGDHGTRFGEAVAINNGRIVGDFGPPPDAQGGELEMVQPFVIAGGGTTVVSTQELHAHPRDINPDGIIVGNDKDERSELFPAHAWVRQTDGTEQNLPELKNDLGAALGINRFGAIVGYSEGSDGWPKAVLWRPQ